MIENFPKNGNFYERKKVFVQFPFHSMNHQLPFNWSGQEKLTQQKRRIKSKQLGEHEYIQKVYDMKMDQKLRGKFKDKVDTFRVIPNQNTSKRDQEALAQQIQQFNTSKIMPSQNPEQHEFPEELNSPLQHSHNQHPYQHQSAVQINNRPYIDYRYHPSQYEQHHAVESPSQQSRVNYQPGPGSRESYENRIPSSEEYNQMYRPPYVQNKNYNPSIISNQRKYANLTDSTEIKEMHPMRNYLPDQLEGYLRDQAKVERRKRPLQASLSKDRMKI